MVAAWQRQIHRQGVANARLGQQALTRHCALPDAARDLLAQAIDRLRLSARAFHRILRVARTVADLDDSADIGTSHLTEAIGYRRLDRTGTGNGAARPGHRYNRALAENRIRIMLQFDNVSPAPRATPAVRARLVSDTPGQKAGLTGANGTGKSSLFALVLGGLTTDEGAVRRPAGWIIAHVAQEMPATTQAAIEYVLDGDGGLRAVQRELAAAEQDGDGEHIAHLHAELDHIGGYQANSRAASLMSGLGFRPQDETRPLADFSGGWRMRLNLARALMCRSDLLLLDEPTNHLISTR